MGLLTALAGGAGGEAGRQVWAVLSALVRRPFQRSEDASDGSATSSGEAELSRLEESPTDQLRAQALSTALAVRAAIDSGFHSSLEQWHEQAKLVRVGDGGVNNVISGGSFHGPTVLGGNFSGLTFTTHAPSSAPGTGSPPQD
ncbi:hypothetical protein [Streptomyces sp. GC420]|uniref:hypothetical protein n=1 Tax=Streptomyces sp. GC420 TaxID=2697568 RepID=UPI0028BE31D2|nr:hypothetical protein [Streptomyces sp. GC420]